jgi:hypothetical protein
VRLIVQPVFGGFELCARLGLLLVPGRDEGKIVHAVLEDSPSARAGIEPRDIIVSLDRTPWEALRHLTFSDRHPSDVVAEIFVARYFTLGKITVRVSPEPYRRLEDIDAQTAKIIAVRPAPDTTPYRNPRPDFEERIRELTGWIRPLSPPLWPDSCR